MNKKRLGDLVRVLRGVPKKEFDMEVWGKKDPQCGTVACAAGHYMLAFPKRGMRPMGRDCLMPTINDGLGRGLLGCDALSQHFSIPIDDVDELFCPEKPLTPKAVARRFEKYMKTGQVPA